MKHKSNKGDNKAGFYEVEEILRKKIVNNKAFYLIKWKRYSFQESSWVPLENLNCPKILKNFENKLEGI